MTRAASASERTTADGSPGSEAELRVLFVCHSRQIGGSELYLEQMARRMARTDDVRVVCRQDASLDEWATRLSGEGARIIRLSLPSRAGFARLRAEVRRSSVVHLTLANRVGAFQALVTLACRLERKPLVCTHQLARETEDLPFGPLGRRFRTAALSTVYGHAARHIAVSADGLELLARRVGLDRRRTLQISNGVDLDRFTEADPEQKAAARDRRFGSGYDGSVICCTVARLSAQKGLDTLIDAAAILRDRAVSPAARFVVVGDGELRQDLERQIERRDLRGVVWLAGTRPPAEVPDWLAAADMFVLPSHYEGMSFAVMEAMAIGLPVVISRVSGTAELVPDDEHGRVVEPGDPVALADTIAALLPDGDLRRRMGKKASSRVRMFSWEACFQKTAAVLRGVTTTP